MPNRDDAATQPLPVPAATRERRPLLRRLALIAAASWASGGALVAAQYAPSAAQAPRLVRGAAWSAASVCLLAGAVCIAAAAAMCAGAVAVHCARAAEKRRRILYGGVDGELAAKRARLVSLAAQATALSEQDGRAQQGRVLRLAGAEGRPARRDRHGA